MTNQCCCEEMKKGVCVCVHVDGSDTEGSNSTASDNGAPIGHILAYMGTTAPEGYLACDGAVYSVTDHPALSEHIRSQFGRVDYFGGDGTETFAVPDLRNEFLRGYHGGATDQCSDEIGIHQKPTMIPSVSLKNNTLEFPSGNKSYWSSYLDATEPLEEFTNKGVTIGGGTNWTTETPLTHLLATRPMNVAVLYCIKCA